MADIFSGFNARSFDLKVIFKNQGLTEDVQRHVARVYSTLTIMVLMAALGAYANVVYGASGGFLPVIAMFGK